MNEAKALLDSGDLTGATNATLAFVKAHPTNIPARIFLFELSIFGAEWDRAKRQLDVIGHQDASAMVGSLIYEQCIIAEKKRADFFASGLKPEFVATPPDYIYGLLTANNRVREGKLAEARSVLDQVDEQRPAFACVVDGVETGDLRDASDLTSCVLEVIIKDSYVWVPFEQIVKLEMAAPQSQRDCFWRQATLETDNGTNGEVFIPALYHDSWRADDDAIRLGQAADWRDLGEDVIVGEGGRVFAVGGEFRSLLKIDSIEMIKE
jgi:type VI secretion system protein ImpE